MTVAAGVLAGCVVAAAVCGLLMGALLRRLVPPPPDVLPPLATPPSVADAPWLRDDADANQTLSA